MAKAKKLPAGLTQRGDVYYARCRLGGRLVQRRLSTDLRTATTMLNELKSRADRQDFGLIDNAAEWADVKKQYLTMVAQTIKQPRDYVSDLAKFEAFAQPRLIKDVTPGVVAQYREHRLGQAIVVKSRKAGAPPLTRKVSPRTVNREVGTLSAMLTKAVEWELIATNPIAGVKPLKHTTPRKVRRALTAEEVGRLFEASPGHLLPVWRTLAVTGMRAGELTSLQVDDVDFEGRCITVRAVNAKSGRERQIPVDETTLAMLRELVDAAPAREPMPGLTPRQTEQQLAKFTRSHVFVSEANTPILGSNLLRSFHKVCRKAGIEGAHQLGSVDLHSLRVTACTLMLENGAPPRSVQGILGHATLDMTMRVYGKVTESGKRAAVSALPYASDVRSPDHVVSVSKVCPSNFSKTESLSGTGVARMKA